MGDGLDIYGSGRPPKVDRGMAADRMVATNVALLVASVMVWCGGASAASSCKGTYAATPLQPLPERVVLDLDIRDRSQRSLMLADRSLRGACFCT